MKKLGKVFAVIAGIVVIGGLVGERDSDKKDVEVVVETKAPQNNTNSNNSAEKAKEEKSKKEQKKQVSTPKPTKKPKKNRQRKIKKKHLLMVSFMKFKVWQKADLIMQVYTMTQV